jgi:hypothetical protein
MPKARQRNSGALSSCRACRAQTDHAHLEDIADVVIQHVGGGQSGFNSPDNWNLDEVNIECGSALSK